MFCGNCGSQVTQGNKFCQQCGSPLPGVETSAASTGKKGAAGFFSSPAGIALVVVLGLLIVAGIVVGIVFAVSGGKNNSVDAATMDAWAEYENILGDNGEGLSQITIDQNALTAQQEALKNARVKVQELEDVLARSGGTEQWRANRNQNPTNTRDIKASQLAATMEAYVEYLKKMDEFLGALIAAVTGNQLSNAEVVNNLNAKLAEVQDLAAKVKKLGGDFVEDNDQLTAGDFEPAVLEVAKGLSSKVEQSVKAAQAAEAQRLESERVAAEQQAAAEEAELERQRQEAAELVTCPLCNGSGTMEGGDGRYPCAFCGTTGRVTRSKAATFNPMDWI